MPVKLYIGGAYQGKLRYLRQSFPEDRITYCSPENPALDLSRPAISGLHLWIWAALAAGREPVEEIRRALPLLREKTILCDELGGGIVPMRREDRRWREAAGRTVQLLAGEAGEITEFLAGIPRLLLRRQTVYLLRHGLTAENIAHRYCGSGNPPLSPEGRERLSSRRYPPVDRCFSSPSLRAVETLRFLYGREPDVLCPGLSECSFGEFEGRTHEELDGLPAYRAWCMDETGELAPPGGESRREHRARVSAALAALLEKPFERAAVLSHGGAIVRLMETLFPRQRNFYEWQPAHGEGYRLVFENGAPVSYRAVNGKEEDQC